MRILHISEIDNDISKGTSSIIPEHFKFQYKYNSDVYYLNCNNICLDKVKDYSNYFMLKDNRNMNVIKNINPDLIVFHEVYKPYYLKIFKYCCCENIPYIIIPHGCLTKVAQNNKKIKKLLGNFLLFNKFINHALMLQFLSESECVNSIIRKVPNFILGNGINEIPNNNLYLNIKNNKNTKDNYKKISFVYVGRYDYKIKGLDLLLEACKIIKQKKENNIIINLYGLGSENDLEYLNNYVLENQIDNIVKINGPVYGKEKLDSILSNDIFIQVSRSEGQPLGVIEALSLGMPVLLSEGTGYKQIIEKNNIGICTKTDKESIYNAIMEVANNKEKLKMYSKNAYSYAKDNYSWDIIAKKALLKYESIVK